MKKNSPWWIIIVLFALLFQGILPVYAQTFGFGVRPTDTQHTYFVMEGEAGQTIQDSLSIINELDTPRMIKIMAVRGQTAVTGGTFLSFEKSDGTAAWITFNSEAITGNMVEVAANSQLNLPFTLTVPADAQPGEYVAGFLVTPGDTTRSSQTLQGEQVKDNTQNSTLKVDVISQAGTMVIVNVSLPGKENCQIAIEDFQHKVQAGKWKLALQLHNTGNIHFRGAGTLSIRPVTGDQPVNTHDFGVGYFIAGDTILYPITGVLPPVGRYIVEAVVTDKDNPACTATFLEEFEITDDQKKEAQKQEQEYSGTAAPISQKAWYESPLITASIFLVSLAVLVLACMMFYMLILKKRRNQD